MMQYGANKVIHNITQCGANKEIPRYGRESGLLSRYNDWPGAGRSGDLIPVEARFSAPVQTGSGAHPTSYTMSIGSFPGVKRPGRGVDHPPNLTPRLKNE
jgi:hypothetical protein